MDGSLARAKEIVQFMLSIMSFSCNDDSPSENFHWNSDKWKLDIFGALLSITFSLSHANTLRYLRRCRRQGISKQTSLWHPCNSNRSKADELEKRHPSSFPVICTSRRWRLVRFFKQSSLTVVLKAHQTSFRCWIEFPLPLDKREHKKLYFAFLGNRSRVSSSSSGVIAISSQLLR